jgi:hypothetical protein
VSCRFDRRTAAAFRMRNAGQPDDRRELDPRCALAAIRIIGQFAQIR